MTKSHLTLHKYQRLQIAKVALDVSLYCASLTIMLFIRFDLAPPPRNMSDFLRFLPISIGVSSLFLTSALFFLRRSRYGSFEDVALVTGILTVITAVSIAIDFATSPRWIPISVLVSGGLGGVVASLGARFIRRLQIERRFHLNQGEPRRVILFGAGKAGTSIVNAMLTDPAGSYVPIGFLDDDRAKQRSSIKGVPVLGTSDDLEQIVRDFKIEELLICAPNSSEEKKRSLALRSGSIPVSVRILPPVHELIAQVPTLNDIRSIREEDLLSRSQVSPDNDLLRKFVHGHRVLVTGAGGSIGSELCRQISELGPQQLLMLDRDESALHNCQLSIEGSALLDSDSIILCDIRDKEALSQVFKKYQPSVVFHAAALKHLPILERFPYEAFKTNVQGTLHLLQLSRDWNVEVFVNVSTDKAANPENILGYSKRATERLTTYFAKTYELKYLSVRFGNVLGSRGSVLETFRSQVERGIDLTVTDPDVERFFMTVEEAVALVIHAGAVGTQGEILVLDMGEQIKIRDVAQALINGSGKPLKIRFTGLRPGEKIREELVGNTDTWTRAVHPLINHYESDGLDPAVVESANLTSDDDASKFLTNVATQ